MCFFLRRNYLQLLVFHFMSKLLRYFFYQFFRTWSNEVQFYFPLLIDGFLCFSFGFRCDRFNLSKKFFKIFFFLHRSDVYLSIFLMIIIFLIFSEWNNCRSTRSHSWKTWFTWKRIWKGMFTYNSEVKQTLYTLYDAWHRWSIFKALNCTLVTEMLWSRFFSLSQDKLVSPYNISSTAIL